MRLKVTVSAFDRWNCLGASNVGVWEMVSEIHQKQKGCDFFSWEAVSRHGCLCWACVRDGAFVVESESGFLLEHGVWDVAESGWVSDLASADDGHWVSRQAHTYQRRASMLWRVNGVWEKEISSLWRATFLIQMVCHLDL